MLFFAKKNYYNPQLGCKLNFQFYVKLFCKNPCSPWIQTAVEVLCKEIEKLFFFPKKLSYYGTIRKSPHLKAIPAEGDPLEHSFQHEIKS